MARREKKTTRAEAREAAARLPKTMPARDERLAVPENPHSAQYSALSGGYTNREEKPTPGTGVSVRRGWLKRG